MKTIYQTGRLLLFLIVSCTTAKAQNIDTSAGINSPGKKSNMQLVFIDRFVVPNTAKAEFLERMKINRDFIKTLPGFIEDSAYEEVGETESYYVTTAIWRDDDAIQKARAAVTAEYQREGFNPPEFMKKLNIKMERGVFKKLQD
jgi:heme-degrading monooxygenase HmoA